VSRPLLLAALEQLGAGPNTLAILAAMYAADEISVRGAPPDAEFFASAAGVKQGDNASPCLFVAVLDIILRLAALDAYVVPRKGGGQLDATVIGYADDLVLFHSDPAILQANFRRVADTLAAFGLQVNVKKTEAFGLDLPTPIRRSAEAMLVKHAVSLDALGAAGVTDTASPLIHTPRIRMVDAGAVLTRRRTAREATVLGVYPTGAPALRCPLCPAERGFAAVYATNKRTAHHTLVMHMRRVHDVDAVMALHATCEPCGVEWTRTHNCATVAAAAAGKPTRSRCKRCTLCPVFGPPNHVCVPAHTPAAAIARARQPSPRTASRFAPAPRYPFELHGKPLEWCRVFRYLGRLIDSRGGSKLDIANKLRVGRAAHSTLHSFLRRTEIPPRRKAVLMQQHLWSKALYSAETWTVDAHDLRKLRALQSSALRSALGARPQVEDRPPTDAEIRRRLNTMSDDGAFAKAMRPTITFFKRERTASILRRSRAPIIDRRIAYAQRRFYDEVMSRDDRLPERAAADIDAAPPRQAGRARPPTATTRRLTLYDKLRTLAAPAAARIRELPTPMVWLGVGIDPT
jgi:hypothetical protein